LAHLDSFTIANKFSSKDNLHRRHENHDLEEQNPDQDLDEDYQGQETRRLISGVHLNLPSKLALKFGCERTTRRSAE
jgi:hypothetical protein